MANHNGMEKHDSKKKYHKTIKSNQSFDLFTQH